MGLSVGFLGNVVKEFERTISKDNIRDSQESLVETCTIGYPDGAIALFPDGHSDHGDKYGRSNTDESYV